VKRSGKIFGVLAALALAGGLAMAMPGTARADVVPAPTWNEIVPAYVDSPACLDDPSGSATPTNVQLYHCHGYASNGGPQRWLFSFWGTLSPGNTVYIIRSHNLCLGPDQNGPFGPGMRVALITCNSFGPVWTLHSRNAYSGDPNFTLELGLSSGTSHLCMALPDFTGGNGEPVTLEPCNSFDELQNWLLG
jgi:Ricin-type beta-trefoil lectin domain